MKKKEKSGTSRFLSMIGMVLLVCVVVVGCTSGCGDAGSLEAITQGATRIDEGEHQICVETTAVPTDDVKQYYIRDTAYYIDLLNKITFSPDPMTLAVGATGSFTLTYPADYDGPTSGTWKSDDASIASVDESGTVTAIAVGSTTVRYITQDGDRKMQVMVVEQEVHATPTASPTARPSTTPTATSTTARPDAILTSVDIPTTTPGKITVTANVARVKPTPSPTQPAIKLRVSPDPIEIYVDALKTARIAYLNNYMGVELGTWSIADNLVASIMSDSKDHCVVIGVNEGQTYLTYTDTATGTSQKVLVIVKNTAFSSGEDAVGNTPTPTYPGATPGPTP